MLFQVKVRPQQELEAKLGVGGGGGWGVGRHSWVGPLSRDYTVVLAHMEYPTRIIITSITIYVPGIANG